MRDVVIFGVGSALIVDVEETLARGGYRVVAGVRNFDGTIWVTGGYPIIDAGDIETALLDLPVVIPLFQPANRLLAVADAKARGFRSHLPLIDPTAVVPRMAEQPHGIYVNAGAVLGAAVTCGRHVMVNRAASIGHHCHLGDFVSLGPRATVCGSVTIDTGALVGAAAVVLPRMHIGAHAVVGAGAVVTRDVPAGATVVGNPARIVRTAVQGA